MVRLGQLRSIWFGADSMTSPTPGASRTQGRHDGETPDAPRDGSKPRGFLGADESPTSGVIWITLALMIGAVLWIGILTIVGLLL